MLNEYVFREDIGIPFLTVNTRLKVRENEIKFFYDYAIKIEDDNLLDAVSDYFIDDLKNIPGIYFLFTDQGKLLYVGKTVNLKQRLEQHLRGNSTPTSHILHLIKYIKFIAYNGNVKNAALMYLERDYIKALKPLLNGAHGKSTIEKTYGYSNLRKKLDSLINKEEIVLDIENWDGCFIDKRCGNLNNNKIIPLRKEVKKVVQNQGNDKFLEAIKESIKLAVKHETEEKADSIIYGFLSGLSNK